MRSVGIRSAVLLLLAVGAVHCTTFGASEDPAVDAGTDLPDALVSSGDASRPGFDATALDASTRDAEVTVCPGVTAGKLAPCVGPCGSEEIAALPANVYPFAFAATADAFFWVEHSAGNASNGTGDSGALKRRRHDGVGGVETVLANITKAPRYAAVAGGAIWLVRDPAFSERVLRVPLDCPAPCTAARELGDQRPFHSVTSFGQGVAVGAEDEILVFDGTGNLLPPLPLADLGPEGDLTSLDGRLVAGTSRRSSPFLEVLAATDRLELPKTLPNGTGSPRAVTDVAADCTGVWAIQTFDNGHLLVRAARGASPTVYSLADKFLPFALEADSTHAYLGIPNAGGGLYRTEGPKLVEVTTGDVWSVAVGTDWVYFDDHTSRKIRRRTK